MTYRELRAPLFRLATALVFVATIGFLRPQTVRAYTCAYQGGPLIVCSQAHGNVYCEQDEPGEWLDECEDICAEEGSGEVYDYQCNNHPDVDTVSCNCYI